MKIIDMDAIKALQIRPEQCVEWVRDAFRMKYDSYLPPKVSVKMEHDIFFNTMPCYLKPVDRFGVKVVSRYPDRQPSLLSDILLYDAVSGNTLALMDANWITAMRTGAVAALAIQTFQPSHAQTYAFMGLGNTARATLLCLLALTGDRPLDIRLLSYKDQAQDFIRRFASYPNVRFTVIEDTTALITGADVVVSCVTAANELFAPDECFKEGVLVVPVHTRGFQNCDLFFDKVFADDTGHVNGFKYFDRFRSFDEFSHVLLGKNAGRTSDTERILAYNIGIALHDVYFASKVYDLITSAEEVTLSRESRKFWV